MNRKKIMFFIAPSFLLFSLLSIVGQNKIIDEKEYRPENDSTKVVINFWKNSYDNTNQNQKLITETPSTFVYFNDPCDSTLTSNKDVVSTYNAPTIYLNGRGNSSTDNSANQLLLSKFSTMIKNGKYKIIQIIEAKEKENEAIVKIGYGNETSPWNQDNFLLYKEKGEWKIFAVMGSWQLNKINKYFARDVVCK